MSEASDLGKIIGGILTEQSSIREQLAGDDGGGSITSFNSERVLVGGTLTITSFTWDSTALVWDHPVLGDLDVKSWDEGYNGAGTELLSSDL